MNTSTADLDIAALDRIDYERPHREDTRDLPCKLSPAEYEVAGDAFAKAVRTRETLELEAQQEAKRRKGLIEAALGEERRLLKILETHSEERPTKVKELWAKRNGEDVLVAVRLDLYTGFVDNLCYVGTRFPQPMDRQTSIKTSAARPASIGASDENLHRQADAAFASPSADEPMAYDDDAGEDEDDRSVIPMEGAAAPEGKGAPKRSRKERAAKAAKPAAKTKPKAKAKA